MTTTRFKGDRRSVTASLLATAMFALCIGHDTATAQAYTGAGGGSVPSSTLATLGWDRPTTNANGTSAGAMSGFRIYYGQVTNRYTHSVYIADGTATRATVTVPSAGRWYFAVAAVNAYGYESPLGHEVSKSF